MILTNYEYEKIMTWKRLLVDLTKIAASPTTYDRGKDWAHWDGKRWHFDCCRSIKAELWGFDFDKLKNHGGAIVGRGYPDYTTEEMIATCTDVSTDMRAEAIVPGELLWFKGHVGVYMGGGNVFECAPSTKGCAITTLSYQPWKKHGKLPVIRYDEEPTPAPVPEEPYAGEQLNLNHTPLYASSSRKEPSTYVSGRYYVSDGKLIRGRIRICTQPEYCGNINKVTGWINWEDVPR